MVENHGLSSCLHFYLVVSAVFYVTSFCEAFITKTPAHNTLYPVIYVPGFGGSQLDASVNLEWLSRHGSCHVDNFNTSESWLSLLSIFYLFNIGLTGNSKANCVIDQMRLVYDPETHKTSDAPGVKVNVFRWGDPSAVESFSRINPADAFKIKNVIIDSYLRQHKTANSPQVTKSVSSISYLNKLGENAKLQAKLVLEPVVELVEELLRDIAVRTKNGLEEMQNFLNKLIHINSYFNDITKALEQLGLKSNISIRSAPYDFRKGPNEQERYFQNLKHLVEETYHLNHNTSVILVVHSMGGLMTLHFLHNQTQEWKDKYIKSLVSLSGAWGGSVKAVKTFIEGDNLDIPFDLISSKTMKKVVSTFPSLAWLMPSREFWKDDEIIATTPTRIYRMKDMDELFHDINQTVALEMYKDVLEYNRDFKPPGVEVHCLYGTGVDTLEQLCYNGTLGEEPDHKMTKDGDKTLSLRSLQGCLRWKNMQKKKVHHREFHGVSHLDIMKDEGSIDYIKSVVNGSVF